MFQSENGWRIHYFGSYSHSFSLVVFWLYCFGREEYVYYGVVPHKIRYMDLRSRGKLYDPAEWILAYETNSSYLSMPCLAIMPCLYG